MKVEEPFSLREEEKRQARGNKPKPKPNPPPLGRGRLNRADKIARAERSEQVFPPGVPMEECWLSHTRPVWRLEQGRAVLVAYEVDRGPKSQYGKVPGVFGRGEFGIEIVLAIAYQVFILGLSFDKVCL